MKALIVWSRRPKSWHAEFTFEEVSEVKSIIDGFPNP